MLKLFRYLKPREWSGVSISLVFIVAQVWLDLKLPEFMSQITVLVQTPGSEMAEIWRAGGYMMLCALGSFASTVIVGFFAARIAASFSQRLRGLLFHKVSSFSMEEISTFSTSSLITRSTNDITQVQMIITMGLQLVIKSPIMAIWAIRKIADKGFEWSLATFVAVAVMLIFITIIMIFVLPMFKKMQTLTDDLNRVTMENLSGVRVVRAYNAEAYQEEKFEAVNADITRVGLVTHRATALMMPFMSIVMNGLTLAIYWIGAVLIQNAGIADRLALFSDMVVFTSYAMQVIMSFMMLVMIFVMLPRASVSAKRINEVLSTRPTIRYGNATAGLPGKEGEVVFTNVSFKYPEAEEYVLRDCSFTAKRGETVAFIGSTGSGKSTLVNLIPRFFDVTEGEITVSGRSIRDYTEEALHNKIGYVPQRAVLFGGSVKTNVAFGENGGPGFTDEEVKRAVMIAQGAEFVEGMENTYDADISQGGVNLSGGQKQRLAIARAICRKPELYIFDDSFSALDYKTDRALRAELKSETAGVTSLIVAQRIGTIIDADQIVVLDEGRIVGIGRHRELLQHCEVYRQIARSQLSEEELQV